MSAAAWVLAAAVAASSGSWDIRLAPPNEPGERLMVMGHVRRLINTMPLAGMHVYAYHADGKGYYAPLGHETEPPRLAGTAITNAKGEFRFRTVMPGAYGGGPAHIHFEVWGPSMPRRAFVMNLAAPAAPDTGSLLESAIQRAAGETKAMPGLYPLVRDSKGMLHGAMEIAWEHGMRVPGAK